MTQALLMRRRQRQWQQLQRQHSRCCCSWRPTRSMAWLTRSTTVRPLSWEASSRQVCTTDTTLFLMLRCNAESVLGLKCVSLTQMDVVWYLMIAPAADASAADALSSTRRSPAAAADAATAAIAGGSTPCSAAAQHLPGVAAIGVCFPGSDQDEFDRDVATAPSGVQICLCCRLGPGVGCSSAQTQARMLLQAACTWPLEPQPTVQWLASITLLGQLSITTAALQVQLVHHQAAS